MSDKVYITDEIPDGYVYGEVTDDYVILYNQKSFRNETADYYKIYFNYSSGLVTHGTKYFGNYTTTFDDIDVSRDILDRPDFFNILGITIVFTLCGIWLLNLITSFIKRRRCFEWFILIINVLYFVLFVVLLKNL